MTLYSLIIDQNYPKITEIPPKMGQGGKHLFPHYDLFNFSLYRKLLFSVSCGTDYMADDKIKILPKFYGKNLSSENITATMLKKRSKLNAPDNVPLASKRFDPCYFIFVTAILHNVMNIFKRHLKKRFSRVNT